MSEQRPPFDVSNMLLAASQAAMSDNSERGRHLAHTILRAQSRSAAEQRARGLLAVLDRARLPPDAQIMALCAAVVALISRSGEPGTALTAAGNIAAHLLTTRTGK